MDVTVKYISQIESSKPVHLAFGCNARGLLAMNDTEQTDAWCEFKHHGVMMNLMDEDSIRRFQQRVVDLTR